MFPEKKRTYQLLIIIYTIFIIYIVKMDAEANPLQIFKLEVEFIIK